MELRIKTRRSKQPSYERGVILWETLWILTVFVWWSAGAHIASVKYWNRRLEKLQQERLKYDGKQHGIHN